MGGPCDDGRRGSRTQSGDDSDANCEKQDLVHNYARYQAPLQPELVASQCFKSDFSLCNNLLFACSYDSHIMISCHHTLSQVIRDLHRRSKRNGSKLSAPSGFTSTGPPASIMPGSAPGTSSIVNRCARMTSRSPSASCRIASSACSGRILATARSRCWNGWRRFTPRHSGAVKGGGKRSGASSSA